MSDEEQEPAGQDSTRSTIGDVIANYPRLSPDEQAILVEEARRVIALAESTASTMLGGDGGGIGPVDQSQTGVDPSSSQGGGATSNTINSVAPASTSEAAQLALFPQASDTADVDILKTTLSISKTERHKQGEKMFNIYREAATKSLPIKFDLMSHQATFSGGGESSRSANKLQLQKQLTDIVHLASLGEKQCIKWDIAGICTMSKLKQGASGGKSSPRSWFNHQDTINLWKEWESATAREVLSWQFSINKRGAPEDRISSSWLLSFLENSSTVGLRDKVDRKMELLPHNQRGGIIYLWYLLTTMFTMTRDVKSGCVKFLEEWGKTGATIYEGENFYLCELEVITICSRLAACNNLDEEQVVQVFLGCTKTSHPQLKALMNQLHINAELGNFSLLGGISEFSSPLAKCKAIFTKACDFYDLQCKLKTWNVTAKGGGRGRVAATCFNCEKDDCYVNACKEPKDQSRIDKNKKAFEEKKAAKAAAGGGKPKEQKKKGTGNYKRSQFGANMMKGGVVMVNGIPHANCKTCGLTTTHSTGSHKEYLANPAVFCLPATHPLAQAKAASGTGQTGPAPPVGAVVGPGTTVGTSATGSSLTTTPDTLILSKSTVDAKLTALERSSTNPDMPELCAVFRDLLLKR